MKKLQLAVATMLVVVGLSTSTVYAWTFAVSGTAVCNTTTGDWDITWTINNPENQDLTVATSDRSSVPVGSTVNKNDSKNFSESLPGTTTGKEKLTVKAEWPSDKQRPPKTAKVKLDGTCKKTPVTGNVQGATTVQVPVVPVGPVNAGAGSFTTASPVTFLGLIGSLSVLGFGLRRFIKQQ